MRQRYVRALVLIGGLVAAGTVAAVVSVGASPAARATGGQALSSTLLTSQAAAGSPGSQAAPGPLGRFSLGAPAAGAPGNDVPGPRGWFRRGGFGHGGFGRSLNVTGVNGNTITATGRDGQTVTVQVSATTAYTEGEASASLSDIHTGSIIAVQGSYANTSGTSINATGITIVLSIEVGVVTNVNGSTLTLTGFDGATHTVNVTSSTRYLKAGQSAALTDVSSGTAIAVEGTHNADGSLTALRVTIQMPRLGGQVTAVNGSSYTVAGRSGTSFTITTNSSTTFVNPGGTVATAATVKMGAYIMAEGSLSSDGKTLTALRVTIIPAGTGRGFGGFGRHGGFGGFGSGGASTGAFAPAPGVTTSSSAGTQSI